MLSKFGGGNWNVELFADGAKVITIHIQNPFGKKWVEEINISIAKN